MSQALVRAAQTVRPRPRPAPASQRTQAPASDNGRASLAVIVLGLVRAGFPVTVEEGTIVLQPAPPRHARKQSKNRK